MEKINQAVILAAGLGTRLRPLTDKVPKVMVPIGGVPLLEHTILLLKKQGFKRFIINLHYLPEQITGHFGNGHKFGVEIVYSDETKELLETGGGLKKMEPLLNNNFALVYGDHLHFFDFRPVIDFHLKYHPLATIVLKRSDLPENGEIYDIDPETKKLLKCHARPHGITEFNSNQYLNSGLSVMSKEILKFVPSHRPVKFDKEIAPMLVERKENLYGFPTDEPILDIGTPEKYAFANRWYEEKISLNA